MTGDARNARPANVWIGVVALVFGVLVPAIYSVAAVLAMHDRTEAQLGIIGLGILGAIGVACLSVLFSIISLVVSKTKWPAIVALVLVVGCLAVALYNVLPGMLAL